MKKNLLLSLIALFCITFANAQREIIPPLPSNEECFNQAEVVFEGYFIKIVEGYNLKGTDRFDDGYNIRAYKVLKCFKGSYTEGDTIYIVKPGGRPGIEKEYEERINSNVIMHERAQFLEIFSEKGIHYAHYNTSPAIFFLFPSDYPDNENSKYFSYNKYKTLPGAALFVCDSIVAGLNDLFFWNREDFYNYMRQFRGFTVPETLKEPENGTESDGTILDSEHYENRIVLPDSTPNETDKEQKKQSKKKVKENPKERGNYILNVDLR